MSESIRDNRILNWLQRCNRNVHKPDLHSFRAKIPSGFVWVECRGYDVIIETYVYDDFGNETKTWFVLTLNKAAIMLTELQMDFDTIEQ